MWFSLMALAALLSLAALWYLLRCFHRFSFLLALGKKHRLLSWVLAALPILALAVGFALGVNVSAMIVVMLHLALAFLLCSLAAALLRRIRGKAVPADVRNAAALLLTLAYLALGWYQAHHVWEKDYRIAAEKRLEAPLRLALAADAHLGTTLDGADFAAQMRRIAALEPDALILAGDFVDDDSRREDMLAACAALEELGRTCPVYAVWGNHDDGYFRGRDFSGGELRQCLRDSGVTVLEDGLAELRPGVVIAGRRDRSDPRRLPAERLLSGLPRDAFVILADHQPNDYAAEAAAGADLVLSGHTHGGHILPAGQIGMLLGANDQLYGMERRGDTTFIVTSGRSGWAIPFKTGTRSEFVIVDVLPPEAAV